MLKMVLTPREVLRWNSDEAFKADREKEAHELGYRSGEKIEIHAETYDEVGKLLRSDVLYEVT